MCRTIKTPNGSMIVCARGSHRQQTARCAYGCDRPVVALCDFVMLDGPRKGKTCDKGDRP